MACARGVADLDCRRRQRAHARACALRDGTRRGGTRRHPARARDAVTALVDELGELDLAVYNAVADTPTPSLDASLRRLSDAANKSKLWAAVAALIAVTGGPS